VYALLFYLQKNLGLNGEIASVTDSYFYINFKTGKPNPTSFRIEHKEFDENGNNTLMRNSFTWTRRIHILTTYEYNSKGERISSTTVQRKQPPSKATRICKNKNKEVWEVGNPDDPYDIPQEMYHELDTVARTRTVYNANGDLQEMEQYDENGNLIVKTLLDAQKKTVFRPIKAFDVQSGYHMTAVYDDKNRMLEQTEIAYKDAEPKKTTYRYDQFDEKGNWTRRFSFDEDGDAVDVILRKIEYRQ
jgi:hypothetical protein